jgi:4'-phosphopantetheinyl transferase
MNNSKSFVLILKTKLLYCRYEKINIEKLNNNNISAFEFKSVMKKIDLYYADINDWDTTILKCNLLQEELNQFKLIKHKNSFNQKIVNRALLRHLLSHYTGMDKKEIILEYNSKGKPRLEKFPYLYFNSTHSHHLVLIGISTSCQIGIDIELIKEIIDEEIIAKNFFSSDEYVCYKEHVLQYPNIFYQFWTAKEAIIKALGLAIWESNLAPEVLIQNNRFILKHKSKVDEGYVLMFPFIQNKYIACLATNFKDIEINIHYLDKINDVDF